MQDSVVATGANALFEKRRGVTIWFPAGRYTFERLLRGGVEGGSGVDVSIQQRQ
jgi:hypothetical protein